MLPWRKISLSASLRTPNSLWIGACRMMVLLGACHWCLGGFTPDRAWGEETSAQSYPSTGSSSAESSAQSSPKTDASGQEYSFFRPSADYSWRFFPTPEEVQKYRKSWNPFSHGPILANSPDVQPKNQWLVQMYVFSEIGNTQYGNSIDTRTKDASVHLKAIAPTFFIGYGITDNMEIDVAPQLLWYNSTPGQGPSLSGAGPSHHPNDIGLGDTTIYLKTRHRIQDPDSWKGTFTTYHGMSLPTSQWFGTDTFGTHSVPGGFAPLGRLPATKFGGLSFTEGLMWRKNLEPMRYMASVYYTYTVPGSTGGISTYNGDIVNTRAIAEWIVDPKRGIGLALEFLSIHGMDYRLDGHALNVNPVSYNLIGLEPSVQYTLFHGESGALVAAAGVLFSVVGQNDINAVYPNMSIYYYWAKKGAPVMR